MLVSVHISPLHWETCTDLSVWKLLHFKSSSYCTKEEIRLVHVYVRCLHIVCTVYCIKLGWSVDGFGNLVVFLGLVWGKKNKKNNNK